MGVALVAAFVPLVAVVGGALRVILGVRPSVAIALGAIPWCFLMALLLWRFRPSAGEWRRCGAVAFAAIVGLLAASWMLDAPGFGGLVSVGGGDAGNHVMILRRYATDEPRPYFGFVAFYALANAGEALFGCDTFHAIRIAFLAVPLTVIMAGVVAIALPYLRNRAARAPIAMVAGALLFTAVLWGALLPMVHYLQADGFYPQVCALVTLVLLWLSWGLIDEVRLRFAALVVGVALYRYSYGLNLGDAAFCAASLCLLELLRTPSRPARVLLGLIAAGMVGGGAMVLAALFKLRFITGGLGPPETRYLLGGLYIGSAVLLASGYGRSLSKRFDDRTRRLFQFAGILGLVSAALETAYYATGQPPLYYIHKHGFHPAALVALAVFVLAAQVIGQLLGADPDRSRTAATKPVPIAFAISLAAIALFWASANPYRHSFVERARRTAPFRYIEPLYDLDAAARIERVLGQEKKSFGGYLTPAWAEANFANAALDHPRSRGPEVAQAASPPALWMFHPEAMLRQPGYCVFWQDSGEDVRYLEQVAADPEMRDFNFAAVVGPLKSVLRELDASVETRCEDYSTRWDAQQRRHLCHRCF